MRNSICITEPSTVLAGDTGTWSFSYITAQNIPAKGVLKFDLLSSENPYSWQFPKASSQSKQNMIWAVLPNGNAIAGKPTNAKKDYSTFEFSLPTAVNQGEKITIFVGSTEKSGGNRSQLYIQRRRPFHLYIDPKGKGDFKDPEIFTLDVKGNRLEKIRIITPSFVFKNSRFDIHVRFEDAYGNLTGNAPEGTLIELSYQQLRENLNWKLFIPETGFLTLPNLYFNETGFYTIRLQNMQTKECFYSPPIMCFDKAGDQLYWGLLHGEAERFSGKDHVETALSYFQNSQTMQFFATSLSEQQEEITNEDWKLVSVQVAEFNEEERFVSMLGFQWFGEPKVEGLRHFVYAKDHKPLLRSKDSKYNQLKKIYKTHTPKELLSIPCFTMAKKFSYNFSEFNPDFERVVEIYNAFGSSEMSEKKGNLRPIKAKNKKGISETEDGSLQKALNRGFRFGFVAGGYDRHGIFANVQENQERYSDGITAVLADDYTRGAIMQALYNRKCYATTGAKILLSFAIAQEGIGSELCSQNKPGLLYNRHISGFVGATDDLKEVTIVRNGVDLVTFKDQNKHFTYTYDDNDPLESVCLKQETDKSLFVYYYLRVVQKDGHIGWSSPIWIDLHPDDKKKNMKK